MRLRLKRGLLTLTAALLGLPLLTGFALDRFDWNLPAWVPIPVVPLDNPMTNTKVELGRHLFYDTRLSADKIPEKRVRVAPCRWPMSPTSPH